MTIEIFHDQSPRKNVADLGRSRTREQIWCIITLSTDLVYYDLFNRFGVLWPGLQSDMHPTEPPRPACLSYSKAKISPNNRDGLG